MFGSCYAISYKSIVDTIAAALCILVNSNIKLLNQYRVDEGFLTSLELHQRVSGISSRLFEYFTQNRKNHKDNGIDLNRKGTRKGCSCETAVRMLKT